MVAITISSLEHWTIGEAYQPQHSVLLACYAPRLQRSPSLPRIPAHLVFSVLHFRRILGVWVFVFGVYRWDGCMIPRVSNVHVLLG